MIWSLDAQFLVAKMMSTCSTLMPYMRRFMNRALFRLSRPLFRLSSPLFRLSRPPIACQKSRTEKAKGPKILHEEFVGSAIEEDVSLEDQYTIRIKQ